MTEEKTIFIAEEKVIKESETLLTEKSFQGSARFGDYKKLYDGYMRIFKQLRRLIRISDKEQLRMSKLNRDLDVRNAFIKDTLGRYLSDEIVDSILESPEGLELGGERRKITVMMTDLRGFTAISERIKPEQVVQMLNNYFNVMLEVIPKYDGTVLEFIGDALIVCFGAPHSIDQPAHSAVACSIAMQNQMSVVNEINQSQGLPNLEMGIGLNTDEVILGNIGSSTRQKYTVIGKGVNMASRIESYTVGGQVLISESVRNETVNSIRIDKMQQVAPKGAEAPIKIFTVGGIAEPYHVVLREHDQEFVDIQKEIPITFTSFKGKDIGAKHESAIITRLTAKRATIKTDQKLEVLQDIKMNLQGVDSDMKSNFYGKISVILETEAPHYELHFTAIPIEILSYFKAFVKLSQEEQG